MTAQSVLIWELNLHASCSYLRVKSRCESNIIVLKNQLSVIIGPTPAVPLQYVKASQIAKLFLLGLESAK